MKMLKLPKALRKKLRATTMRRPLAFPKDMEFEEMSEPNMKLSRALLIVLVLHIVAVAGILAFNTIKNRQPHRAPENVAAMPATAQAPQKAEVAAPITPPRNSDLVAVRPQPAKPAVSKSNDREVRRAEPAQDESSGKTYTVAKGDNPVKIAKKLGVSYDALIELNKIDDPRKLKIGQKLLLPPKARKAAE